MSRRQYASGGNPPTRHWCDCYFCQQQFAVPPSPRDQLIDAIADELMQEADRIAELSPRPMSWMNLDANTRHAIAVIAVSVAQSRGWHCG